MPKGKRRSGKRTKSGRLSRAGATPRIVRGNDRAMERKDRFGSYATEAIGRAYYAGLLGHRDDPAALERFRKGCEVAAIWRRHYAPHYRCALNDNPRGGSERTESHRARNDYHWMRAQLDEIDRQSYGSWFHQFVLAEHPDHGPSWLDRLLDRRGSDADRQILALCIEALDIVGTVSPNERKGVDVRSGICQRT